MAKHAALDVALAVATVVGILATGPLLPFQATHLLSDTCNWHRRGSWAALGRGAPDTEARRAEDACWARRGAHGPGGLPVIHVLLAQWPTPAELAAMNGEGR